MPVYSVIVWGRNCVVEFDGRVQRLGFYATRFYEAADHAEAGSMALASVRAELEGRLLNTPDALPTFTVDQVLEVDEVRGPNKGRAWYVEGADDAPSRAGFGADVASAARALARQPSVPLVSLIAWFVPAVHADVTSAVVASARHPVGLMLTGTVVQWGSLLFLLGWYGAERVFFQRHLEAKPVTLRHLLGLVKPFIGRFFVLGLPFGILIFTLCGFVFAASFAAALKGAKPQDVHWPFWFWVSFYILLIAMDFALTFVTSALAYTTRSVRRAVHIGFAMIRQTWPTCALYVLCPPLALNVMAFMFPVSMPGVRLARRGPRSGLAAGQRSDCGLLPARARQLQRRRGCLHSRRGRAHGRLTEPSVAAPSPQAEAEAPRAEGRAELG